MPTRAVMQTLAMLPIMQLLPVLPTQLVRLRVRLKPLPPTPAPQQVMPAMPTRLRLPQETLRSHPRKPGNKPINPPPNLGKRARASMLHKLSQPRHQRKPHNNRSTHPSPLLPTNRTP